MKLLIFLITAAVLSASAVSADNKFKSIITPGIYAENLCSDDSGFLTYVAGQEIYFPDDRSEDQFFYVYPMDPTSELLDSGWQQYGQNFARMSKDAGVEWIYWTGDGQPPPQDLASLPPPGKTSTGERWEFSSLRRCDSLPLRLSIPHGEAISFLLEAQEVIDRCGMDYLACVKGLFDIADRHPDGELTIAEWSRVVRTAVYWGLVGESHELGEEIDPSESHAGFGASLVAAPLLAKALISSYDYDGDGKTSLKELSHDVAFENLSSFAVSENLDDKARAQVEAILSSAKALLPLLDLMGR